MRDVNLADCLSTARDADNDMMDIFHQEGREKASWMVLDVLDRQLVVEWCRNALFRLFSQWLGAPRLGKIWLSHPELQRGSDTTFDFARTTGEFHATFNICNCYTMVIEIC